MNYGFIVSYDGSRYEGWQRQTRTKDTIQGKLEDALERITGAKGQVIGAGRTDAGVHALGQYANVHLQEEYDLKMLQDAWNRALPDDISIHGLAIRDERFHSRFSAVENTTATVSGWGRRKMYSAAAMCGSWEKRWMWKP